MENIKYRFVEKEQVKDFSIKEWTKFTKERDYKWDEKIHYLAAFSGKDILGYAKFIINGGMGELKEIIVRKDLRGERIGSKLMDMYEEFCSEKGCHLLVIRTAPKIMGEGFDLYKKRGYKIEAELKNEKFNFDWVVMFKRLKQ